MKKILITMGDPSGVGGEIAVKALESPRLHENCIPILVGDLDVLQDSMRICGCEKEIKVLECIEEAEQDPQTIHLINLDIVHKGEWEYKKVCKISGEAAFQYIVKAIQLAMEKKAQAVVTCPINKEAINLAGHHYSGHTEIFADYTNTESYGMLLTSSHLRVIHVTTHVSMRDACDIIRLHPERVEATIALAQEAMHQLGIEHPRIAVAGLNPHSSENGLFGDEEQVSISKAIESQKAKGIQVEGPIPPDSVFVKAYAGAYDVVVAMYHDQGHIPLKLSGFKMDAETGKFTMMSGVNTTIGLPIIRTSVDHGTAFDRAGDGRANENSLIEAVEMANQMANVRFGTDAG